MRFSLIISALLTTICANATSSQGMICRDDRRMENGSLREVILTPSEGGFVLQSQYMASLHSPEIEVENWATKLSCRLDKSFKLAFCKNEDGQHIASITERRETYYDSLEEHAKRKIKKYTDISVHENGVQTQAISFAASHCQSFGSIA